MRKSLWIMLALIVVAVGAPNAHADTYAISFAGGPTVVGSDLLNFDPTTGTFTTPSIEISFGGMDLTLFRNSFTSGVSPTDSFGWSTPGGGTIFEVDDNTLGLTIYVSSGCSDPPCQEGGGSVSLTPVTTAPEPSSLALVPFGLAALLLMRKRASRVRPSAI